MGPMVAGTVVLAGVNAGILVVLSTIWARNYRAFRSALTLGLLTFGVVLLVENLVAIYFHFSMLDFYATNPLAGQAALVLRGLQFLALGVLAYVTVQ